VAIPNQSKRIAIIGGGITGLTAAWRLHSRGHRVRLFEAGDRPGGSVRSERSGDWLIEAGPNTIQVGSAEIIAMLDEIGLGSKKLTASPAAKNRYLIRNGRLHALPSSPPALLTSRLFSTPAKLRAMAEFLARRRTRTEDPSLAEFVRGHFGQEFVDYALEPFVSGIFAGNPERLSTRLAFPQLLESERTHGSILRGQIAAARKRRAQGAPRPQLLSFADGLQTLIDTLVAALPAGTIELRAKISSVQPGPPWRVSWQDGAQTEEADAIVLALPASALASLCVGSDNAQPLAALSAIEYPPVASLFLGFKHEDVAHPLDGFGLLVPGREKLPMLGVLFSSTMFPGRAPAGHVALTIMAGGARQPELARLAPDALLAAVRPGLRSLLGVQGDPVFIRHKSWPHAIPQYNLGYDRFLNVMAETEKNFPGLLIGGHVRDGIALSACITSGLRLAERATALF
jgi:oxygen-dependent protoporphyrinogen oxidase